MAKEKETPKTKEELIKEVIAFKNSTAGKKAIDEIRTNKNTLLLTAAAERAKKNK